MLIMSIACELAVAFVYDSNTFVFNRITPVLPRIACRRVTTSAMVVPAELIQAG
jgi:hypothetical protein